MGRGNHSTIWLRVGEGNVGSGGSGSCQNGRIGEFVNSWKMSCVQSLSYCGKRVLESFRSVSPGLANKCLKRECFGGTEKVRGINRQSSLPFPDTHTHTHTRLPCHRLRRLVLIFRISVKEVDGKVVNNKQFVRLLLGCIDG